MEKTRVRDRAGKEVNLKTYEDFRDPKICQQNVFAECLKKVSQRAYQKGLPKIAASFGFSKISVSRKWIKATATKLEEFQNRSIKEVAFERFYEIDCYVLCAERKGNEKNPWLQFASGNLGLD